MAIQMPKTAQDLSKVFQYDDSEVQGLKDTKIDDDDEIIEKYFIASHRDFE